MLTKIRREVEAAEKVTEAHHGDSKVQDILDISEREILIRHMTALHDMTKPIFNLRKKGQAPLDSQDIEDMTLTQVKKALSQYGKAL